MTAPAVQKSKILREKLVDVFALCQSVVVMDVGGIVRNCTFKGNSPTALWIENAPVLLEDSVFESNGGAEARGISIDSIADIKNTFFVISSKRHEGNCMFLL